MSDQEPEIAEWPKPVSDKVSAALRIYLRDGLKYDPATCPFRQALLSMRETSNAR